MNRQYNTKALQKFLMLGNLTNYLKVILVFSLAEKTEKRIGKTLPTSVSSLNGYGMLTSIFYKMKSLIFNKCNY
jgi:hypothetical protein